MTPRLYLDQALAADSELDLPPGAARHVQVLRLQPGDAVVVFDGRGGEFEASIERIGARSVGLRVGSHRAVGRELDRGVTIALGMPANERMDALVEKATELGAAAIQPLVCERSVLRLGGERAARRQQHWQEVAVSAAEQSGRTRVPQVQAVARLDAWLAQLAAPPAEARWLLDPDAATPLAQAIAALAPQAGLIVLSGPEGGLTPAERGAALGAGFAAVGLGPRVLRADTAPLAALAGLGALGA